MSCEGLREACLCYSFKEKAGPRKTKPAKNTVLLLKENNEDGVSQGMAAGVDHSTVRLLF